MVTVSTRYITTLVFICVLRDLKLIKVMTTASSSFEQAVWELAGK